MSAITRKQFAFDVGGCESQKVRGPVSFASPHAYGALLATDVFDSIKVLFTYARPRPKSLRVVHSKNFRLALGKSERVREFTMRCVILGNL